MRFSKEDIVKREKFAFDMFKQQPEMPLANAAETMKATFGSSIVITRLSQIRNQALGKKLKIGATVVGTESVVTAAARPAAPSVAMANPAVTIVKKKIGRPKKVVEAAPAPTGTGFGPLRTVKAHVSNGDLPALLKLEDLSTLAQAVTATLDILRKHGVTDLAVVDSTAKFVIIDRA